MRPPTPLRISLRSGHCSGPIRCFPATSAGPARGARFISSRSWPRQRNGNRPSSCSNVCGRTRLHAASALGDDQKPPASPGATHWRYSATRNSSCCENCSKKWMSPAADQPLPPVEEANKERAQRHLLHFVRQEWPVLEPATSFLDGAHIEAICEHLEAVTKGDIHNLLINVPPRHMKSLAVCV